MRRAAAALVWLVAVTPYAHAHAPASATPFRLENGAAHFAVGGHDLSIALSAIGRGDRLRAAGDGSVTRSDRIEITRAELAGVVEWWRPEARGVEHGVTIADRAPGVGPLVVAIAVGGLAARTIDDDTVAFAAADGGDAAQYVGLVVDDADGANVPARMSATHSSIRIEIDDASARYPIIVDPLVVMQEAMFAPRTPLSSVSISADGSRMAVTAGGFRNSEAFVYVRSGFTWTQEAQLTLSLTAEAASVALSGDGATAVVGLGDGISSYTTYADVFRRVGGTWSRTGTLTGNPEASAVAISGNGLRLAVVNRSFNTCTTYTWNGGGWVPDGTHTTATTNNWTPQMVALSQDGSVLAIWRGGDSGASPHTVAIETYSGGAWTTTASLAVPGTASTQLALSRDGTRVVITGSAGANVYGAPTWAFEATLPVAQANTVAMSADGSLVAVGTSSNVALFVRSGTSWTADATFFGPVYELSMTDLGDRIGALAGASSPQNAYVFELRRGLGAPCSDLYVCQSGFCTEGVCCNAACTGSACQSCRGMRTGGTDGTCGALSAAVAPTVNCATSTGPCQSASYCSPASTTCPATPFLRGVLCRAPTDVCDAAEFCDGTSAACPTDRFLTSSVCRSPADVCGLPGYCDGSGPQCPSSGFLPSTAICRPPTDACERAATCTGTSATCPPNPLASMGTLCRAATDLCDVASRCDGTSGACAPNALQPAGTVCRPIAGLCDVAETCSGASAACPTDAFVPSTMLCRVASDPCEQSASCTGTSALCPATVLQPSTHVCRASNGPCDVAETCTGTALGCPIDTFEVAGTVCAPSGGGACDAPDVCTGMRADCPATFANGVVCRPAAGACDVAESCAGTSASCPPDGVLSSGLVCRMSSDPSCDPAEHCDGSGTSCPPDSNTCTAMPDGGVRDAGAPIDGGSRDASSDAITTAADAAPTPPANAGSCGCRAGSRAALSPFGLLAALALMARRRR